MFPILYLVMSQCVGSSFHTGLTDWPQPSNVLAFTQTINILENDDLCPLSDDFENPATLSDWQRLYEVEQWPANQLETWDIGVTQTGSMTMMPYTSTWYQDLKGVLVFKEVQGDFVVNTRFEAANRDENGAPESLFSLAGIFVRAPRDITPASWIPGGENYLFLSAGSANDPGFFQNEVKTTENSNSVLEITYVCAEEPGNVCLGIPTFELRCARLENDHFIMLRRTVGGIWVVHRRYHRTDLPLTLQVGMTTYTDWATVDALYWPEDPVGHNSTVITTGNPDLMAHFDFFHFRRPIIPPEFAGRNFSAPYNANDPTTLSDADLLSFLVP